MRRSATLFALGSTLALFACTDMTLDPAARNLDTGLPPENEQPPANPSGTLDVWGLRWGTPTIPLHWVYYWSGGAARQLTVSRTGEPGGVVQEVVWEVVDTSGQGICFGQVATGHCKLGALAHGQVPAGTQATVEVDPVLSLTSDPPAMWYRVTVTGMGGSTRSFEFTTYW